MKRHAAAALVCVGVGLLAGDALADPLPIPTVPSVTVPVPTVPVPLPTAPKLPTPAVPSTPKAPTPSAGAPSTPIPFSALGASTFGGGSTQSSTSSSSGSSGSASGRPQVKHLHSSRPWIGTSGKKNRRITTLTFVLTNPGRVVFTVKQLSPDCQAVGRFSVRGHAGLNRVRFAGVASAGGS